MLIYLGLGTSIVLSMVAICIVGSLYRDVLHYDNRALDLSTLMKACRHEMDNVNRRIDRIGGNDNQDALNQLRLKVVRLKEEQKSSIDDFEARIRTLESHTGVVPIELLETLQPSQSEVES